MSESRAGAHARRALGIAFAAGALALLAWPGVARAAKFTDEFRVQDCTWKSRGSQNAYFPLKPGTKLVLEGEEEDEGEIVEIRVEISVLRKTERITFETPGGDPVSVRARVYQEREFEDGELVEVSSNWLAICRETGDVFYFGEDVDDYEDGEIVGHGGAWRAGVDGAQPGILFPGRFLLGSRYYQEVAPGVALDRGRNVAMGLEVETGVGTFTDCVGVLDSSALDPGAEGDLKVYCPGVGIVIDEVLLLVETD